MTEKQPKFGKLLAKGSYEYCLEQFTVKFFERKKIWHERNIITTNDYIQNDICKCDDEKQLNCSTEIFKLKAIEYYDETIRIAF